MDGKQGLDLRRPACIPYPAKLLDALPDDSGNILVESIDANDGVMVHRLDVRTSPGTIEYHMTPTSP